MAKKILRFEEKEIDGAVVHQLEQAVVHAPALSGKQPYFFVFVMNTDYIHEFELLADAANETLGAPLLAVCFSRMDDPDALTESLIAAGQMTEAVRQNGLGIQLISWPKHLFNHPSYSQLKTACGVPEGYACSGALAIGYIAEETETEEKYNIFSYIR